MGSAQPLETRGQRLAQARRLLAVALAKDLSQKDMAAMVDVSNTTWNRWEADDDRLKEENLSKIVDLFACNGMAYITAAWIEYGVGEIVQVVAQAAEILSVESEPVPVAPVAPTTTYEEQVAAKKIRSTRRARGE